MVILGWDHCPARRDRASNELCLFDSVFPLSQKKNQLAFGVSAALPNGRAERLAGRPQPHDFGLELPGFFSRSLLF